MLTSEQQCAAASEAAAADAFRAAYEAPQPMQPQTMTSDEHAAVIRRALANDWRVRYRLHGNDHDEQLAMETVSLAFNEDDMAAKLARMLVLAAAGATDADLAAAVRDFAKPAIENAGRHFAWVEAQGYPVTYGPTVKRGWAFWRQ